MTRVAWNRQTPESFWARVQKGSGCWEWQGACNNSGYGTVGWQGRTSVTHRVAAYLAGLVPGVAQPSLKLSGHVLHKCDNPKCCRPDHLYVGTYSRNQLDAYERKRRAQPKSEHVNAKLTPEQVRYIRRVYTRGDGPTLAVQLAVSESTILNVVKGATYVDVE